VFLTEFTSPYTLEIVLEQLIPEDNVQDDTDQHKNIRRLTERPIETTDDREFTQDEGRQNSEVFNPGKHQGQRELQAKF